MAIRISIETGELPQKLCCNEGVSAYDDYEKAILLEGIPGVDIDQEVIDYRERRSMIASHCGRSGVKRCLLEDQCMLDRFPQPENS